MFWKRVTSQRKKNRLFSLPLRALGLGEGAEIRTPMALTVIAGLISSTFLTLVVIPTVFSLVDRRA